MDAARSEGNLQLVLIRVWMCTVGIPSFCLITTTRALFLTSATIRPSIVFGLRKLLATMLLTLKGTPFIYQGDELGMTNYPFHEVEEF